MLFLLAVVRAELAPFCRGVFMKWLLSLGIRHEAKQINCRFLNSSTQKYIWRNQDWVFSFFWQCYFSIYLQLQKSEKGPKISVPTLYDLFNYFIPGLLQDARVTYTVIPLSSVFIGFECGSLQSNSTSLSQPLLWEKWVLSCLLSLFPSSSEGMSVQRQSFMHLFSIGLQTVNK